MLRETSRRLFRKPSGRFSLVTDKVYFLRHKILNQQFGAVSCSGIAAKETDEISGTVIVVIYREI
jgi:hypothetical protein